MKTFRCQKSDQKRASLSHQSHLRKVNRWARMHCPELMLWLYWRHSSNWMQSLSIYCQPALRVDWMTLLGRSSIVRLLDICILGNRSACKILVKCACDWTLNCWERFGRITSSGWFRRFKFKPNNEFYLQIWGVGQLVSVISLYIEGLSSNPTVFQSFFCITVWTELKINEREAGVDTYLKIWELW